MRKNARYSRCHACTAPIRCSASRAPTQRAAKPRAIFPATQRSRAMPVLQPLPNSPLRRMRAGTSPRHALPAPAPVLLWGELCPGSLHARVPAGLPAPACFPSEKPDENQHAPTERCNFFKIGTFQPSCRKAACQLKHRARAKRFCVQKVLELRCSRQRGCSWSRVILAILAQEASKSFLRFPPHSTHIFVLF